MKVNFIKARGQFKPGEAVEIEPKDYQALADAGFVVTAAEYATITAAKEQGRQSIIRAVDALKKSEAIAPKDEDVLKAALKSYDEGTSAEFVVRLVEAEHKPIAKANGTHNGRITDGQDLTPSGVQVIRASLSDALDTGYVKARQPMDNLIKNGRIEDAIKLSRETGVVLRDTVMPIMAKGDNFSMRDVFKDGVVRAADNVDTNVGTLATGMVMLVRTFGFLKNKLTFLDKITTDLRNEAVLFGQNVLTRYVTPPAVATFVPGIGMTTDASTIAAWKATVTAANPAGTIQTSGTQTRSTASTTDVSIVLNQYKGVSISFSNLTLAGTLRNLPGEQYDAQLYSLTEQINKDFLTTLFGSTFSGVSTAPFSICGGLAPVGPPSTNPMGLANIIAIKNKFSLNKMPDVGRFLLLHSAYHDAILADSNLLAAKAILSLIKKDAGAFEDGELPVLFGVKVLESQLAAYSGSALVTITDPNTAPTAAAGAVGFAGNSASAIFVARIPQDYNKILGDIPQTASLEIVTEPDSGLSMLVKKRVDHNLEATYVDCGLMYNFAQGDPRQGFIVKP